MKYGMIEKMECVLLQTTYKKLYKNYELRSYFNRGSIKNNTFQEKTAYQA